MPDETLNPNGDLVVDADGHVCEPADLWDREPPVAPRRPGHPAPLERGHRLRRVPRRGRDRRPTAASSGSATRASRYDDFGRGRHYEDLNPAGLRPARAGEGARRRGHRRLGDVPRARAQARRHRGSRARGVVVPGLQRLDRRVVRSRARPPQGRGRAARCRTPQAAADEAHRIKDLGLVGTLRPPERVQRRPVPPPALRRRCGRRSRRPGSRSGCTSPASPTCRARRARMGSLMAPGTHHALIPVIDQMMTLSNLDVRRRARAAPRPEGGGARERRRLDRALDGPPQRVRGELPLGRGADVADARGVLPAPVLDQLRPGRAHAPVRSAPLVGADRFIWASDFPHNDAKYPGVVDELREHNDSMPDGPTQGLFGLNALELYGIPHASVA